MSGPGAPEPRPPAWGRRTRPLAIGALFAIALLAIVWGYADGQAPAPAPPAPPTTPAPAVTAPAAEPVAPDDRATAVAAVAPAAPPPGAPTAAAEPSAVRGVVKPKDEVMFFARIPGRIAQMPYREGERFKQGALLVGFDCSRLRAEGNAARAASRASEEVLRQSEELDRFGAIGTGEVQIAKAKAEQGRAEAAALEAQMRDCSIHAPFSGVVAENLSRLHEYAEAGKELTRVLNDSELEVHLIVPSAWLGWLQPGKAFEFKVDETGLSHPGKVARLGAAVDPVSQTVRVLGVFTGPRERVLPGMSGSARFSEAAASAPARP